MGIAEVVYCALCMVLCTIPAKFIAYTTLEYTCTGVVYFYVSSLVSNIRCINTAMNTLGCING